MRDLSTRAENYKEAARRWKIRKELFGFKVHDSNIVVLHNKQQATDYFNACIHAATYFQRDEDKELKLHSPTYSGIDIQKLPRIFGIELRTREIPGEEEGDGEYTYGDYMYDWYSYDWINTITGEKGSHGEPVLTNDDWEFRYNWEYPIIIVAEADWENKPVAPRMWELNDILKTYKRYRDEKV